MRKINTFVQNFARVGVRLINKLTAGEHFYFVLQSRFDMDNGISYWKWLKLSEAVCSASLSTQS
jgi:hypothetical protein